jgi:acetate kinase
VTGRILVLNTGSSSVKFSLYDAAADDLAAEADGELEGIGVRPRLHIRAPGGSSLVERDYQPGEAADQEGAIASIRAWVDDQLAGAPLAGVGHRVVHGGETFTEPVRVTDEVLAALERLVPLAPLHEPVNLGPIRALRASNPDLPQVACFDTAFHASQPPIARAVALPRAYTTAGIRRYGFHGLSFEYIASCLPDLGLGAARVVVAHLGNGASLCAMRAGRSVATTMGFSVLDGLVMGTRPGTLDAGVLLYLIGHDRLDLKALERLLYHESGLLGVSGISSDMRELLASSDVHAREAIDLFVYRIGRELGSMAAALGGIDALVFTGGIGENAAPVRARVCHDAAWLGIQLDEQANERGGPRLSPTGSPASAWVVPTDENLMIARHTVALLSAPAA